MSTSSRKNSSKIKKNFKTKWSHNLCDICAGPDAGCNCCVQNCCCQPCVWGSSLLNANIPNAQLFTFLAILFQSNITIPCITCLARRNIIDKYNIEESPTQSFIISCCCPLCARIQEIDMIMENENLKYACAVAVEDFRRAPQPKLMQRP